MKKIKQKKNRKQLVNSLESTKKQKYRNVPTPRPSEIIKKKRIYISNELKLKNYIYELFGWLHEEPEVIID